MMTLTVAGTKHMTPRTAFDDAAILAIHEVEVAEHLTLKTAGEIAHVLSSGTATEQMLGTPVASGGHGHPYGHGPVGSLGIRGAIPNGGDPAVINIQTGEFAQGWQEETGFFAGGVMTNVLENNTEHAKLLEETPDELQIRRPIVDRIVQHLTPIREMNLQSALSEINKI
jgi:hypothetical protein